MRWSAAVIGALLLELAHVFGARNVCYRFRVASRAPPDEKLIYARGSIIITIVTEVCCAGYARETVFHDCEPVCKGGCGSRAECTAPSRCTCKSGYQRATNSSSCQSPCEMKGCEHGSCVDLYTCSCDRGYRMDVNEHRCKPICEGGCGPNGLCFAPNDCRCQQGFLMTPGSPKHCVSQCKLSLVNAVCVAGEKYNCKPGYELASQTESAYICRPTCDGGCYNGVCVSPNTCACLEGYERANSTTCSPICENVCSNGDCSAPATCSCHRGYSFDPLDETNSTCLPTCAGDCINAECSAPDTCTCLKGYQRINDTACTPVCDKVCANADYVPPDTCRCYSGYGLDPHDETNSTCVPQCPNGCTNGTCTAPNVCTCMKGYRKKNNSTCFPICENTCTNGNCVAPGICSCKNGYVLDSKDKTSSTCLPMCSNDCINAECSAPNTCSCLNGYKQINRTMCIPACKKDCSNGECVAPDTCQCQIGYKLDTRDETNSTCVPTCRGSCVNAECTSPNVCSCWKGYIYLSDNKSDNASVYVNVDGDSLTTANNKCVPTCRYGCYNGTCVLPDTCQCFDGYQLDASDHNNSTCVPICRQQCFNGTCVAPGGSASLQGAFWNATGPLAPPTWDKFYTDGSITKQLLAQSIQSYLEEVDNIIDRMARDAYLHYEQAHDNYVEHMYFVASHPEMYINATNKYDISLENLVPIYRRLVALVQNGASSTSSSYPQAPASKSAREFVPWTPEEVFNELPDVISAGLTDLRNWALSFLDAGLNASNSETPRIMREKREQELFPPVRRIQRVAVSLQQQLGDEIQANSSPDLWAEYVEAREELLNIEFIP